ncbi:NAD(P)-dependent oxidoreductase [Plebeiibacterium marinum]|uniref:NAD(P)-binding domain-containing protein n=1 Tax=Plebeiibacterium marinum TaxID=2992111 RepID=A0AAE3MIQ2_9BACT|nr:NAD(P)-dependent oxidoreductase [Plebeiobacterium marinum]MCW3807812.1 NAD(P)-binding domain-containing protein [Plebeiobacterium marinum]
MKKKILVTYKIPPCGFDELDKSFEVIFPEEESLSKEELSMHLKDTVAIVSVFGHKLSNDIIDQAPNLKLIANFGVGYDNIDIPYVTKKGITVTNTPDPVTEPTAELAMGLMVAVSRQIGYLNNQLRKPGGVVTGVMKNLSTTLSGKTLGIIGMGAIGQALARRALAFGMKIVYHNRKQLSAETESKYMATKVNMETLLRESDIVSLNCPLTPETKHLIGAEAFEKMKDSAILINTARGPVVNQNALIKAIQNKLIAGAGLDVYENEPHIPQELLEMDQVVLTPHTGTATLETREAMSRLVSKIIRNFFDGTLTGYIVN